MRWLFINIYEGEFCLKIKVNAKCCKFNFVIVLRFRLLVKGYNILSMGTFYLKLIPVDLQIQMI